MIGKLTGALTGGTADGSVLVEVGGVGYSVRVPLSVLSGGFPRDISLFVHTAVREDAIDLYGFPTLEELAFFKQLIGVSSIGPKTALGILNVADVGTLKHSIARGDATMLTKVFGLGKKSAERIVVELRDKLAGEEGTTAAAGGGTDGEVIEALMALGYGAQESRQALKAIGTEGEGNIPTRLAAALRRLGSHAV